MAAAGVCTLTDLQKSDKFQRALSLNFDCGSDTLRKLIETELDNKGVTLKKFIKDPGIQSRIKQMKQRRELFPAQVQILNSKDLECMDISLLTKILLELLPTSAQQKTHLINLRKKRNELAHKPKSMLEDDVPFIEASQLIITLSKDVSSEFEEEVGRRIEDLKKRELVRTRSNMEILQLNNESLMVKLVETGKNEKVDGNDEVWIKLGLTNYVRQLAKNLDVDVLLQDLKAEDVISDTVKRRIEQYYNFEEQMQLLVLHMMNEKADKLLKFCVCVRKLNSLLADLVQHRPSAEKDIAARLLSDEKARLNKVLILSIEIKTDSSIACEDVHLFLEEKQKCAIKFSLIQECIKECFPTVNFEENDSRFHGITWKDGIDYLSDEKITEDAEEIVTGMPCDRFGSYLSLEMERIKEGIGCYFEQTASKHWISAEIFAKATDKQMEELFGERLREAGLDFVFGVKAAFLDIKSKIKRQMDRTSLDQKSNLRNFDTPVGELTYTKSTVRPSTGNLLTAAHVFYSPLLQRQCSTAYIVKEVIRFALACINGKKNGTIHFGIKEAGSGKGDIIGLPKDMFADPGKLDDRIVLGIRKCFDERHYLIAERCIRPVQVIPVEDDLVVLEVDIVPFSGYFKEPCIQINYPPKGFQRRKCFVLRENTINSIEATEFDSVFQDMERLLQERMNLERKYINAADHGNKIQKEAKQKLIKLLTGGNKYVTDAYLPVICSGDISGCPNEADIRDHLSRMTAAFTSAIAVFDFDSSVELRSKIEKGDTYFNIKMAEDFTTTRWRRESDITGDSNIWLYSNGNDELGKHKMDSESWYAKRLIGVKNVMHRIRQQIPMARGLVIFLVFQKQIDCDPMLEIARETLLTVFKDECVIIAENDVVIKEWQREMIGKMSKRDLERITVTGLSWEEIVTVVQSVFKPNKDVLFKFPDSGGHSVQMTRRELDELQLRDIELVDGNAEEYFRLQEEDEVSDECCRLKRSEEQERFYKGNAVTWRNFYYATQVGKRDAYEHHREDILHKLSSTDSRNRFEIHHMEHNPGAGGSTVARNILWHLSQIGRKPEMAFRCCIVQGITENTADEVYRFQQFKERSLTSAKPVIVLVDNKSEEHIKLLRLKLDEIAYKKGAPGKLFCLLLIVTRVPVSYLAREVIIKHTLSNREKMWFEKKFKELESNTDVKVNTLIAFNVMRHSFDFKFIEETTKQIMDDVSDKEQLLLECLSLICSFDSDNPVPETIFDAMMLEIHFDPATLALKQCINKPFGLVWSEKERRNLQKVERETWNVNLTGAMQLLITHRRIKSDACPFNGVCILSQPLSKAIMKYIMQSKKKNLKDIVNDLLDLVEQHAGESNQMSKLFVRIVGSLFTSRERESYSDDKKDTKVQKFSPLVLQLEKQSEDDTERNAQSRVVEVINRCFNITGSAMVGQQLARYYYINVKNYDAAEETIKRCLTQLPHHSYLLDTYGQIYKTKMEQFLSSSGKTKKKLIDMDAAECIKMTFKAVEKFKLAQEASTLFEENNSFNSNCFYMEVMTVLNLLENFHRFGCFADKTSFWEFLNEENVCVEKSTYKHIIELAPALETFRKGQETHLHLETSLRILEERAYMIRTLDTVLTPSGDELLVNPRQKFEMFYGSKEHTSQFEFLYGVGLKLLMKADTMDDIRPKLLRRVNEAKTRLEDGDSVEKERDLLVYIGYNIMKMSAQELTSNSTLYKTLLNYSTNLWTIQRNKGKKERRYVEAYLYYALLHWILPERKRPDIENISHPETYSVLLKEWQEVFMHNNNIKNKDQLSKVYPKTFFALGHGLPGNDVVDLEWLRHLWREAMQRQGRARREVMADNHWQHPIFVDRLKRFPGTVDGNGRWIFTEVTYRNRDYTFKIRTTGNYSSLSNRAVTFLLAFSWMSPVALDVQRNDKGLRRQTSQRTSESSQESSYLSVGKHETGNAHESNSRTFHQTRRPNSADAEKSIIGSIVHENTTCSKLDSMLTNAAHKTEGANKKPISPKIETAKLEKKLSPVVVETEKQTANTLLETKGRGVGRGRGLGRGRGKVTTGAYPKSQNTSRVGNLSNTNQRRGQSMVADSSKAQSQNPTGAVAKSLITKGPASSPHQKPISWSTIVGSGADTVKVDKPHVVSYQSPSFSTEESANPSNQIEEENSSDEWHTVTSKKKPSVSREQQQRRAHAASARQAVSKPKQKFEELIGICQEKFPNHSRERLISVYNEVKRQHGGSVKGLDIERLLEEIAKNLRLK